MVVAKGHLIPMAARKSRCLSSSGLCVFIIRNNLCIKFIIFIPNISRNITQVTVEGYACPGPAIDREQVIKRVAGIEGV